MLPAVGLFAGIGGIETGLSSAGHDALLLCEIDPFARQVLQHHFPKAAHHDDVRTLSDLPSETKLLTAGFPCQDLSQAGRTRGLAGANSGLVGEVFRALNRKRVPLVLLENVPFMLQLAKGESLEVIVSALEQLGYVWAYRVVDARAFGLPQRRERVFLLACLDEDPRRILFADEAAPPVEPQEVDYTVGHGFYWTEGIRGLGWTVDGVPTLKGGSGLGIPSPPAVWMPNGSIVTPGITDAERLQGFPADWTDIVAGPRSRGARWKLVGNAVSVRVAEWLGQCLAHPRDFDIPVARPLIRSGAWPRAAWNVGDGRRTAPISAWPVQTTPQPIAEFLEDPAPLSAKATAGFLQRTGRGSLRFKPGFLDAVRAHLERMRSE